MKTHPAGLASSGLARQIAESIRAAIMTGRLRADERLPTEDELAQRFSVSRPTIREALKRLAAMNLIHSRRGPTGGSFITTPTLDDSRTVLANTASLLVSMDEFAPEEIIEARRAMELSCVRLAITRRTDDDIKRLEVEILNQDNPQLSDEQFCASDVRFHQGLVRACHNPVLVFQSACLIDSLQPVLNLIVYKVRDRQAVVSEHSRLTEALKLRSLPAAELALNEYLDVLLAQLMRVRAMRAAQPLGQFTAPTSA
jgi:GntR family transcriptional regulator, transcriptional repressor for pyruvate dehydrogenase complex